MLAQRTVELGASRRCVFRLCGLTSASGHDRVRSANAWAVFMSPRPQGGLSRSLRYHSSRCRRKKRGDHAACRYGQKSESRSIAIATAWITRSPNAGSDSGASVPRLRFPYSA